MASLITPEAILNRIATFSDYKIKKILKSGEYCVIIGGMCKYVSEQIRDILYKNGIYSNLMPVNLAPDSTYQPKKWWLYPPHKWASPHWIVVVGNSDCEYIIDATLCQEENDKITEERIIPYIIIDEVKKRNKKSQ